MPIDYPNLELLHEESFQSLDNWHHEGAGELELLEGGGMRMACLGSQQGAPGCMAFFRPDLPDAVSIAYDVEVKSHGGLIINYLAIRGMQGEDLIEDAPKLEPRDGSMRNYYATKWGLQSYHVSYSRFGDDGTHTETSNWKRNPGCLLVGHGIDLVQELHRTYRLRLTKDAGCLQLFVDGQFAHGFIDRDSSRHPIPDWGKFGIRLIGSDVSAEFRNLSVHRIGQQEAIRRDLSDEVEFRPLRRQ